MLFNQQKGLRGMAVSLPDFSALKRIDWRRLAASMNAEGVKDLDSFLDLLPSRAGVNGLIAASIVWVMAALSLLVLYTKSVDLQEVHKQLVQAEALRPSVPTITYKPVTDIEIKPQMEKMQNVYKNLTFKLSNGVVTVSAASTREFPAWRAAIGDLAFGGAGWRIQSKEMCVGRDCGKGGGLLASLSVQKLDISIPPEKAAKP